MLVDLTPTSSQRKARMNKQDTPVERIDAIWSDGQLAVVERLELRHLVREPLTGKTVWSKPATWYRCAGIEVILQPDGTWACDQDPRLTLRRR